MVAHPRFQPDKSSDRRTLVMLTILLHYPFRVVRNAAPPRGSAHNLDRNPCAITQNKAERTDKIGFFATALSAGSVIPSSGLRGFKTAFSSQTLRCQDKNKERNPKVSRKSSAEHIHERMSSLEELFRKRRVCDDVREVRKSHGYW